MYPARYRLAADYALWSAIVRGGHRITNVAEVLVDYREAANTFGAANKLGRGGEESATIMSENVLAFTGMRLSAEECRAIDLLYFPEAGLSAADLAGAYLNMRRLARSIYGRIPTHVARELDAGFAWALAKRWSRRRIAGRHGVPAEMLETARRVWHLPAAFTGVLTAGLLAPLGELRLMKLKSHWRRKL